MKRIVVLFVALLLLCLPAMAEEVIELPDAVVTCTMPEGFYVLTRESSASAFTRVGMSQREVLAWMQQNDVYLSSYNLVTGCELGLVIFPAEPFNLDTLSPQEQEALCAATQQQMDEAGYIGVEVTIHRSANLTFVQRSIPGAALGVDGTIISMLAYEQGYCLMVEATIPEGDETSLAEAHAFVDSLRITLPDGMSGFSAHGVSIRLTLPEGLTLCETLPEAPEAPAGEVIGAAEAADGAWFVQWQLFEGATGDMERLSATGLRALYEARAKQKRNAGFTVTLQESCTDLRQTYVHIRYEIPGGWYAEEYYTKQGGWGVIVTAYSQGAPLPEEAQALLLQTLATQLITVKGK